MRTANRYVSVYLNDHLGGATLGVELVKRAAREHRETDLGTFLSALAEAVESDRESLLGLMREFGVKPQRSKIVLSWAAEKIGRLKPNGRVIRRSPVTALIELDAIATGICGKRLLWVALPSAFPDHPGLSDRVDALAARAEQQLADLEPHRRAAARAAASRA